MLKQPRSKDIRRHLRKYTTFLLVFFAVGIVVLLAGAFTATYTSIACITCNGNRKGENGYSRAFLTSYRLFIRYWPTINHIISSNEKLCAPCETGILTGRWFITRNMPSEWRSILFQCHAMPHRYIMPIYPHIYIYIYIIAMHLHTDMSTASILIGINQI